MTPAERRRLRTLVERELESPRDDASFRQELLEVLGSLEPALRLLDLKEELRRSTFYVKSEHVWYRKFGFRMMRPLFLVSTLAAVGFLLQDALDPTLALLCFVGGAFLFYVVLQLFAWRWARLDERKLAEFRDRYRRRLERLRDELEE
ncbi:MAG: hypothetical protein JXB32_16565 [Deltaproteobacteria bacterium]|nr:hypothetical protein [Deltaproteobacteria bacterium]